jgi:hypothetical protein
VKKARGQKGGVGALARSKCAFYYSTGHKRGRVVRIVFISFIVLLAAFRTSLAQTQIQAVEIVRHGIYTAEVVSSQRDKDGVNQSVTANIRRAVDTTDIPLQVGVRFGIEYKVIGGPADAVVSLKKVMEFPPAGIRSPGSATPLYRNERMINAKIGQTHFTGIGFSEPTDLVAGIWVIQLWDGQRKLAEQKFTARSR